MKFWIARDVVDDKLHLFPGEPHFKLFWWNYRNQKIEIDKNMFPEVTFENNPQQVELKLVNGEQSTKLWITRDYMGLWLYTTKPLFNSSKKEFESVDDNTLYINDDKLFPEVTFENSPQQVEIKLINE